MVYILLGTGFEEMEAIAPLDLLRRADIPVQTVGIGGKTVYGSHNIGITADITVEEMDLTAMEMLVLPGGLGGVASIQESPLAMDAIRFAHENDLFIGAICAAPTILAGLSITDGKRAVCYPSCAEKMGAAIMESGPCTRDGKIITGTSAGCAVPFGLLLIDALRGAETANTIKHQIVIR